MRHRWRWERSPSERLRSAPWRSARSPSERLRILCLRADADKLHLGTVEIDDLTVKRLRVIETADEMDGSNEA